MSSQAALPILITLPHGGLSVPPEVADRLAIDATRIYNECDLWVDSLFASVAARSLAAINMPIARVLVDANRDPAKWDDPDGAIKTTTSYGEPIYRTPLTPSEQGHLLAKYYRPFHHALSAAIAVYGSQTSLLMDCHNMAQHGPAAYGDAGAPRPLLCLANFGDTRGEPRPGKGPVTCNPTLLRAAGDLASQIFADVELLEPDETRPPVVALNQPFAGGYALRTAIDQLAKRTGRAVPGFMVEINRGLFVGRQTPDTPISAPRQERIDAIRDRLDQWATQVVALLPHSNTDQPIGA